MSTKYLGEVFDIHGGGIDLQFPHHECEIAQSTAALGKESVRFWMHNNMITINGQKMARSLNNFITLDQLFAGDHPFLQQAYGPMTIRFFLLQAHYRSTIDFSNEALQAAEKGFQKLMKAVDTLDRLKPSLTSTVDVSSLRTKCYEAMDDDLNSPVLLSYLFEGVKYINSVSDGTEKLTTADIKSLKDLFATFIFDILGLKNEEAARGSDKLTDDLMRIIITLRQDAKAKKEWGVSDKIRDELNKIGILVKDKREDVEWKLE